MHISLFENISSKQKDEAVENLIEKSSPRQDFFLMVSLSIAMATLGLLANSVVVIIGSMLIAPMLYPILSIAMGVVMSNRKLITLSCMTLLKSIVLAVLFSALISVFSNTELDQSYLEIYDRSIPSLVHAGIAIIAGIAASFAFVRPQLNESFPGIAIAVSLIPPLAVIGIGIAYLNWTIISGATLIFLINAGGIIFSSMIIFSIMNLHVKRNVAKEAIMKEEKIIKKEEQK